MHCDYGATFTALPLLDDDVWALEVRPPWAEIIMSGRKCVETRQYPLPPQLLGRRLEIVEPMLLPSDGVEKTTLDVSRGRIVGSLVVREAFRYPGWRSWRLDYLRHCVSADDRQNAWQRDEAGALYGWVIDHFERYDQPRRVPTIGRAFRSLFRFIAADSSEDVCCHALDDGKDAKSLGIEAPHSQERARRVEVYRIASHSRPDTWSTSGVSLSFLTRLAMTDPRVGLPLVTALYPHVQRSALALPALCCIAHQLWLTPSSNAAAWAGKDQSDEECWRVVLDTPLETMQKLLYFVVIPDIQRFSVRTYVDVLQLESESAVVEDSSYAGRATGLGKPALEYGKPKYFVSFDMTQTTIADFADALACCCDEHAYYWVDVFCAPQHQPKQSKENEKALEMPLFVEDRSDEASLPNSHRRPTACVPGEQGGVDWFALPALVLSSTPTMRMVLVCNSWAQPSALRRLWVLWELFCAHRAAREICIALPSDQRQEAVQCALTQPVKWDQALETLASSINVTLAHCTKPAHEFELRKRFDACDGGAAAANLALRRACVDAMRRVVHSAAVSYGT